MIKPDMTSYKCAGVCLIVVVMATTADALTSSLLMNIAEHPPVYLAEPFVTLKPNRCDVLDVSSYDKIVFEGFVNMAKLMPGTTLNGTVIFGFKENVFYDPPPICIIVFTWTPHGFFCALRTGDFVGERYASCFCHTPIGLQFPVSIVLTYTNLFHRSREHVLHVLTPSHTFSSAPRIVKMPRISNIYGECNATRPIKVRFDEPFPEQDRATSMGTRSSIKSAFFTLTIMPIIFDVVSKMAGTNC